jgi:hypothetical protein
MKKIRFTLALLPALWAAKPLRADPCVELHAEPQVVQGDQIVYELDFRNRCGGERNVFWCAENPQAPVPPQIACPSAQSSPNLPAENSYAVSRSRRFQWRLPRGTRIRFADCPASTRPTLGFGCLPLPVF